MSESSFYSDRSSGPTPRTQEEITPSAWKGLVTLIRQRIADGSLAQAFPNRRCSDYPSEITETNDAAFYDMLEALVPSLRRPKDSWGTEAGSWRPLLDPEKPLPTPTALDIVDFVAQRIAEPLRDRGNHHPFFNHYHLVFDREAGQQQFQADVEEIFARNGIAFTWATINGFDALGRPKLARC